MTAAHALVRRAEIASLRRSGDVRHDLAVFAELLRDIGVGASPGALIHAVEALTRVRLDQRADFRIALECCLTASASDRALFDVVFDTFWSPADEELPVAPIQAKGGEGNQGRGAGAGPGEAVPATGPERADGRQRAGRTVYSRARGQRSQISVRRRREVDVLCRRLARSLGTAAGRRRYVRESGVDVDLRASLRRNLGFGEELILLQRSQIRRERPRIVILCDVSSSMRPWTPFFLTFAHSLASLASRVEVGVFNVDLVMASDAFGRGDLPQALSWLDRQQVRLSGGTRIGHCLGEFIEAVDRRGALRPDTIVLILSDGWDVGEMDVLDAAMTRLHRSSGLVVWCDPHAAASGFDPQVKGLRVALKHVDDYVQLSDLPSLTRLVEHLGRASPSGSRRIRQDVRELHRLTEREAMT